MNALIQCPLVFRVLIMGDYHRAQLGHTIDPSANLPVVKFQCRLGTGTHILEQRLQEIRLIAKVFIRNIPAQDCHHRCKIQSFHLFTPSLFQRAFFYFIIQLFKMLCKHISNIFSTDFNIKRHFLFMQFLLNLPSMQISAFLYRISSQRAHCRFSNHPFCMIWLEIGNTIKEFGGGRYG